MLVVTRSVNQRILIGDDIWVSVVQVKHGNSVRIGIEAPKHVRVVREELLTTTEDLTEQRPAE